MKIAIRITGFIVLLVIILMFFLYLTRSRPVIYALIDSSDPLKTPFFTIFNPFRDKEPEKAAKVILDKISKGNCKEALKDLKNYEDSEKRNICLNEAKHPITKAKLIMIKINGPEQRLTFDVRRVGHSKGCFPVEITVNKVNNEWKVISYDTAY